MRKKIKYFLIVFNLILFTIIAILLKTNNIANFDNRVYEIIASQQNIYLTYFFKFITFLCSVYFITGISIIILLTLKKNRWNYKIILNILICLFINQLFKFLFKRERPIGINLIEESNYSFPSGHAMISLSFYGFIIYIIGHKDYSILTKSALITALSLLVLLIGISRIYLGVHYASDVIAGFALSIVHLVSYTLYYKKIG